MLAGSECAAISPCAIIYNYDRKLNTSQTDLVIIMNVANELYAAL